MDKMTSALTVQWANVHGIDLTFLHLTDVYSDRMINTEHQTITRHH